MLTKMNNKAKVCRLTKSIVLEKAKVISFKDIEVARIARAAKEVIKGKGKCGRKRKRAALEADELEIKPKKAKLEVARAAKEAINSRGKRGRKRKSAALEADNLELELELEPEVAQMIDALVL